MVSNDQASLIYRNHASSDFGIWINVPWNPVHPPTDGTTTHVNGRNGDLFQSNDSFSNVTETFTCTVIRDSNIYSDWWELEDALNDWLQVGQDYDYLQFSLIPDWAFEAMAQPFTLAPTDQHQATLTLTFNCKPLMTALRGLDWHEVPNDGNGGTIVNQTDFTVHPDWHIVGNGDLTLTINGMEYYFDDVEGELFLNSDGNAWYTNSDGVQTLANDKIRLVNNDSPELLCGKNTVQFGASVEGSDDDTTTTTTTTSNNAKCYYKAKWKKVV